MKVKEKYKEQEGLLISYDVDDIVTFYMFVDVREPKNLSKLKDEFGAITVLIERPSDKIADYSNHADADVKHFHYDFIIKNHGTLEHLKEQAKLFMDIIKNGDNAWLV